jgi:hypothetical protein
MRDGFISGYEDLMAQLRIFRFLNPWNTNEGLTEKDRKKVSELVGASIPGVLYIWNEVTV